MNVVQTKKKVGQKKLQNTQAAQKSKVKAFSESKGINHLYVKNCRQKSTSVDLKIHLIRLFVAFSRGSLSERRGSANIKFPLR